jgi:hypothetical protein
MAPPTSDMSHNSPSFFDPHASLYSSKVTNPAMSAVVVAIAGMIFPAMILASCFDAGLIS